MRLNLDQKSNKLINSVNSGLSCKTFRELITLNYEKLKLERNKENGKRVAIDRILITVIFIIRGQIMTYKFLLYKMCPLESTSLFVFYVRDDYFLSKVEVYYFLHIDITSEGESLDFSFGGYDTSHCCLT